LLGSVSASRTSCLRALSRSRTSGILTKENELRKFIIASAVGGLAIAGAFFAPGAHAATMGACTPAEAAGVAQVCGQGDPAAQTGGAWVQGGGTAPGPVSHGYLGVNDSEGVVGCANGTYTGSGDNVLTPIPPTGAPAQPDPTNPCFPQQ
jgi:hypothetical protein